MTPRRLHVKILSAFLFLSPWATAAEWSPYLSVDVYGGQSFFSGDNESPVTGPNGAILFVPAVSFSEHFTLMPSVSARYQAVRDVQELAGGGFLTQEQQIYNGDVKGIWVLNERWRAKGRMGYKREFIKDTTDEPWGKGLFDYGRWGLGAEMERRGETWRSLRWALDFSETAFPNFDPLTIDDFGAEIAAGDATLDFRSYDVTWEGERALGDKASLSLLLFGAARPFRQQAVVEETGLFTGGKRMDYYVFASAAPRVNLKERQFIWSWEPMVQFNVSGAALLSNQNNYAADVNVFNPNYYDYREYTVGTDVNFRVGGRATAGVGVGWTRRGYADRPVQSVDATFTDTAIWSETLRTRLSLGYPLGHGFSVSLQGAYEDAKSNMRYESTYRYNYSSSNYFLGLNYEM